MSDVGFPPSIEGVIRRIDKQINTPLFQIDGLPDINNGNYPKGAKCLGCGYVVEEGETHCCHANGLQVSVTRFRVKCAKCGKETENFVIAPYGSKRFDGEPICAECIDRADS